MVEPRFGSEPARRALDAVHRIETFSDMAAAFSRL
jgi:hypothetical protein